MPLRRGRPSFAPKALTALRDAWLAVGGIGAKRGLIDFKIVEAISIK